MLECLSFKVFDYGNNPNYWQFNPYTKATLYQKACTVGMSLIVTFLLSCTSELSLSTATEILCYLASQIYYLQVGNHKHSANMTSSVLLEVLEQELFSPLPPIPSGKSTDLSSWPSCQPCSVDGQSQTPRVSHHGLSTLWICWGSAALQTSCSGSLQPIGKIEKSFCYSHEHWWRQYTKGI